jgi:transcription elongation factor
LENVRAEEALMAGAEALAIVHRIDENVEGITEGVQGVQVVVAGINDKLEIAHADIQGVGHEVHSIHAGDLVFSSLAPEARPQPYSIRCNGGQRKCTSGS